MDTNKWQSKRRPSKRRPIKRNRNIMKGDIILVEFGFEKEVFYISDFVDNKFAIVHRSWLSNDPHWETLEGLKKMDMTFIRRGELNIFSKIPILGMFFAKYK